ncbi:MULTISPECIES: MarR family winged helix-turn-helix transcriptional regulator [Nocardiaceae]|uniref:MarR family winged helix-turn-helix transcriptional regulator n=1 Tax=Nocardiaceae TaxID=85025 RepID=UPI0015955EC4|nr:MULTISPECIES: MarR family transcriptional regulator [Rhodococcus]
MHSRDLEDVIASVVTDHYPHLDESALRLATNLKRAANVLVQREESEIFNATNRSSAAVRALTMIWIFDPIEARDISRLSGFSRQAVSGVLTTLERDGLISRERGSSYDRRLAPVSITDEGREFVEQMIPAQNGTEAGYFSALSDRERVQLTRLLAKLIVGSGAHQSGASTE